MFFFSVSPILKHAVKESVSRHLTLFGKSRSTLCGTAYECIILSVLFL